MTGQTHTREVKGMPANRYSCLGAAIAAASIAFAVASAVLSATPARAQKAYPTKAIQVVVPYPAGGSDVLVRKLIIGMSERLGQPIVVLNKPGASTQIATSYVKAAPPDGYILYFANPAELAAGPSLFKTLPFDAINDLTPISHVADAPFLLTASSALPVKTYAELVAFMKAEPEKARFSTYGVQTQPDVLARRFNLANGLNAMIVPYQGGSPALNAIVRNEVQLLFPTTIASRPFIVNNQIRPLAIAAENRVALYPDLPTLKELGVDVVDAAGFALMGPKGLPAEVVAKMHEAVVEELKKPDIKTFMDGLGIVAIGSTPEEAAARLKRMTAAWAEFAPKIGLEKQ
jgi:tripartite-type tricarboxylate transporter receptor subunit TctC